MKNKLNNYLKHIYKAKQCTDLIDVDHALSQIKELYLIFGDNKLIEKRHKSLLLKKKLLNK